MCVKGGITIHKDWELAQPVHIVINVLSLPSSVISQARPQMQKKQYKL